FVTVDAGTVTSTAAGDAAAETIRANERERLQHYLKGWDQEPEIDQLVDQLTEDLLSEDRSTVD
ncbi:hypothetical protein, partial [Mumia sp.]|uniref:hypothetical protein n=1 Tax=Mumia sp. TaxID=1965300 RepID=UPI0026381130